MHDQCVNACSRLCLRCLCGSATFLCTLFLFLFCLPQVTAATDVSIDTATLNSITRPLVVLVPPDVLAQYHIYLPVVRHWLLKIFRNLTLKLKGLTLEPLTRLPRRSKV